MDFVAHIFLGFILFCVLPSIFQIINDKCPYYIFDHLGFIVSPLIVMDLFGMGTFINYISFFGF